MHEGSQITTDEGVTMSRVILDVYGINRSYDLTPYEVELMRTMRISDTPHTTTIQINIGITETPTTTNEV